MSNGLSGSTPLGYQGTNAATPPNVTMHKNAPTPNNYQNFSIGDFWIQIVDPRANTNLIYVLLGVVGNVADWALLTGSVGSLITLTGNSGGAVFPSEANINVMGDGTTINIVGNSSPNTLTVSAIIPPGIIKISTVTLLSSDVKALTTVPFVVVPAPGVGSFINVIGISAILNYGGNNAFTSADGLLRACYTNAAGMMIIGTVMANANVVATSNQFSSAPVAATLSGSTTSVDNKPVIMTNPQTAFTGNAANDNTITVYTLYQVLSS